MGEQSFTAIAHCLPLHHSALAAGCFDSFLSSQFAGTRGTSGLPEIPQGTAQAPDRTFQRYVGCHFSHHILPTKGPRIHSTLAASCALHAFHGVSLNGARYCWQQGLCLMQGLHTAKVKSKRALLVEEGVQFSGTKIKATCVLSPLDLVRVFLELHNEAL